MARSHIRRQKHFMWHWWFAWHPVRASYWHLDILGVCQLSLEWRAVALRVS